jgi:hypothetical protein
MHVDQPKDDEVEAHLVSMMTCLGGGPNTLSTTCKS